MKKGTETKKSTGKGLPSFVNLLSYYPCEIGMKRRLFPIRHRPQEGLDQVRVKLFSRSLLQFFAGFFL
jgi:hypothetical protein